jgi:hypothetical protein
MSARRSVVGAGLFPPRRLTAAETEGYTTAKIRGGCAIQTIGMSGGGSLLLAGVVVALAAATGAAWLHEARPRSAMQPAAQTVGTRAERPRPPALTADEERFATALWAVHREATRLAVATSAKFCGRDNTSRTRGQSDQRIKNQAQFNLNQESSI